MCNIVIPEIDAIYNRYRELVSSGLVMNKLDQITENLPEMVTAISRIDGNTKVVIDGIRVIGSLKMEEPLMSKVESPLVLIKTDCPEVDKQPQQEVVEKEKEPMKKEDRKQIKLADQEYNHWLDNVRIIGKNHGVEHINIDEIIDELRNTNCLTELEKSVIETKTYEGGEKKQVELIIVEKQPKKKMSTRKKVWIGAGVTAVIGTAIGVYLYTKN